MISTKYTHNIIKYSIIYEYIHTCRQIEPKFSLELFHRFGSEII